MFDIGHENFLKAKKSLITAALIAILAFKTTVDDNTITLAGLKIQVSVGTLILFSCMSFIYFGIVFVLLYRNKQNLANQERKRRHQEIGNLQNDHEKTEEAKEELLEQNRHKEYERKIMLFIDLGIPCMMSVYVIWKILQFLFLA